MNKELLKQILVKRAEDAKPNFLSKAKRFASKALHTLVPATDPNLGAKADAYQRQQQHKEYERQMHAGTVTKSPYAPGGALVNKQKGK